MAQALTQTQLFSQSDGSVQSPNPINRIVLAWTSDSSGNVSLPTSLIGGTLLCVETKPGSPAPTDNYSVTLLDAAGIDVLAGLGASRSSSVAQVCGCPMIKATDGTTTTAVPRVVAEALTLTVASAGNAKQGSVILYVR